MKNVISLNVLIMYNSHEKSDLTVGTTWANVSIDFPDTSEEQKMHFTVKNKIDQLILNNSIAI